jgi:hypothetical protein
LDSTKSLKPYKGICTEKDRYSGCSYNCYMHSENNIAPLEHIDNDGFILCRFTKRRVKIRIYNNSIIEEFLE